MPFYNSEGDEVSGLLSPEEAEALQEKINQLESGNKKFQEQITAMDSEMKGLKDKDFNFGKLRSSKKEERDELLKDFSEKERRLAEKMAELEGKFEEGQKRAISAYEDKVLSGLAGGDEDLKTKLRETAKIFKDAPSSEQEVSSLYANAYKIVKGSQPSINPLNAYSPTTGVGEGSEEMGTDKAKIGGLVDKFFPWAKDQK